MFNGHHRTISINSTHFIPHSHPYSCLACFCMGSPAPTVLGQDTPGAPPTPRATPARPRPGCPVDASNVGRPLRREMGRATWPGLCQMCLVFGPLSLLLLLLLQFLFVFFVHRFFNFLFGSCLNFSALHLLFCL